VYVFYVHVIQIRRLYDYLTDNITISSPPPSRHTARYADVCPRRDGRCVVDGLDLLFPADNGHFHADREGLQRFSCVRRADREAVKAAAVAGLSFEAAGGIPGDGLNPTNGKPTIQLSTKLSPQLTRSSRHQLQAIFTN